jgi:hypothetical protein
MVSVDTPASLRPERVRQREDDTGQHVLDLFATVIEPAYLRRTLPPCDQADLVLDGSLPPDELVDEAQRWIASVWGGRV